MRPDAGVHSCAATLARSVVIIGSLAGVAACGSGNGAPASQPTPTPSIQPTPTPAATPTPVVSASPTPTPTPATRSALDCFNPELFAANATVEATERATNAIGESWVLHKSIRNGQSGLPTLLSGGQVATPGTPEEDTSAWVLLYRTFAVPQNGRIRIYGEAVQNEQNFAWFIDLPKGSATSPPYTQRNSDYHYQPAYEVRFDLELNELHSQAYSAALYDLTRPSTFPPHTTVAVASDTRYLGRETLAGGGGSIETCRFFERRTETRTYPEQDAGTQESFTVETSTWFAVNNGLMVRYERDGNTIELLSATINGVQVLPARAAIP